MGTRFFYQSSSREVGDAAVLADLRRIARGLVPRGSYLSARLYRRRGGRFSITLLVHRFGSWNTALGRAGLRVGHRYRIPDEEFFARLEALWRRLRRQPTRAEMDAAHVGISAAAYVRRFGTWGAAIRAFVIWKTHNGKTNGASHVAPPHPRAHPLLTPRYASIGLRHRILQRDHFKCIHCGRSPATDACVVLHVDHIVPWCKGGQTTPENLQTLCEQCNHGKAGEAP